MPTFDLHNGDCLEVMPELGVKVDAVIADPPYGTTACKWDSVIPFEPMWDCIKGLIRERAAIALFGSQPFTSALVMSNPKWFKYEWVWEKPSAKGHFNAKKRPMSAHEQVCVFCSGQSDYFPQMTYGHERKVATKRNSLNSEVYRANTATVSYDSTSRYPRSVQKFAQDTQKSSVHPTQKPVALLEYLIKTYTNEGDTVLDFTMGSGTTGVACMNTGRNFIGIEMDEKYFGIARDRIETAYADNYEFMGMESTCTT